MVSCVHVSDLSMGSGSLGGGALGDSPDGVAHASPSSERILRYFKGCQILIVSYRLPVRLFMTQGGAGPTGAVQVHPAFFVVALPAIFAAVVVVAVAAALRLLPLLELPLLFSVSCLVGVHACGCCGWHCLCTFN
jgi:hypothetical protein